MNWIECKRARWKQMIFLIWEGQMNVRGHDLEKCKQNMRWNHVESVKEKENGKKDKIR